MATISEPPPAIDREECQRRVTNPLQRLSRIIRFYVSLEGLGYLMLYLSLWFWLGLLLDYVVFKFTGLDWVQVLSVDVRAGLLVLVLAGLAALVAFKLAYRLLREFSDSSLALVLERRFPSILGDRLITAVELAHPGKAKTYGYSQVMVDRTIHDAAQLVDTVPVQEVFDWRRLYRRAYLVLGSIVVGYMLSIAGFLAWEFAVHYEAPEKREGFREFFPRFNDVAETWFSRNILLRNVLWPRRAYLEVLDFPKDEKRIGRDAPKLTLRVRAWKWVIADSRAPDGWRLMTWADLRSHDLKTYMDDLVAPPVPPVILSQRLHPSDETVDEAAITVDEIDTQLAEGKIRQQLESRDLIEFLDKFELVARQPRANRKIRLLQLPEKVQFVYSSVKRTDYQDITKDGHEYSCTLDQLKESVRFTAHGEDYSTPYKYITVVPPPEIINDGLIKEEDRPAYLYYQMMRGTDPSVLKGKKQHLRDKASLSGDATSLRVPVGTNLTLIGEVDKDLRMPDGVRLRPKTDSPPAHVPIEQLDARRFRARVTPVTVPLDLTFEFIDPDYVIGTRRVIITPEQDAPPDVEVQLEVVRKTAQGYMATASAKLPFSGKVKDDHGLSRVDYAYSYSRVEAAPTTKTQTVVTASALSLGFSGPIPGAVAPACLHTLFKPGEEGNLAPEHMPLTAFERERKKRQGYDVTEAVLKIRLTQPPPDLAHLDRAMLRDLELRFPSEPDLDDVDFEYFDVAKLGLKASGSDASQTNYNLRLGVVAADTNVETGPQKGQSKEQFSIRIVSENELMYEIGKDEEIQHDKLKDAVSKLKDARQSLETVLDDLPRLKPDEFRAAKRRAEEVGETLARCGDVTREVHGEYRRVRAELMINRDRQARTPLSEMFARVGDQICKPLKEAAEEDQPKSEESIRKFVKAIGEKDGDPRSGPEAMENIQKLLTRLEGILDAMGKITKLNEVIAMLVELEKEEAKQYERLKELNDELERKLIESLLEPDKKDEKPKKP